MGNNIPCDLYNKRMNKLLKHIIVTMGSNLTESSLQQAARSVSKLQAICRQFDKQSDVPIGTVAHSTRSTTQDITKVIAVVMNEKLLQMIPGRAHSKFQNMKLNPLCNWNKKKNRGLD